MKLTILMPCLNEAETVGTCVAKAKGWIDKTGIDAEVLVADNGSTDGSQELATRNGARVVPVPERGYGSALFHGTRAAQGDYVIMGDADDSYDFSRLDSFVDELDKGYDLVMGNRFAGGIEPGAMPWKNRYIGNPILSWIGRLLFRCPAEDFHCGIRGFRRDAFDRMDLRTTGMEYASEMVIKATVMGMRISEVPTTLSKDGRSRPPHLRPWRDGWRHLRFMLLFSPRWLFLIPGLVIFLLSALLVVPLLFGPIHLGGVELDVHSLFLAQAGLIFGFAMTLMGIVVREFASREGLLDNHRILERLRRSPVLETGGVVGLVMVVVGLVVGVNVAAAWGHADFGKLQYGEYLRSVCLATSLIMLGGLTFVFSLIMGFLALPTREER